MSVSQRRQTCGGPLIVTAHWMHVPVSAAPDPQRAHRTQATPTIQGPPPRRPSRAVPGRRGRSRSSGGAVRVARVGLDHDGGRNPKLARIVWPSGPANQVRNAWAAATFADALTTTPE
jgi:hypothetical protein